MGAIYRKQPLTQADVTDAMATLEDRLVPLTVDIHKASEGRPVTMTMTTDVLDMFLRAAHHKAHHSSDASERDAWTAVYSVMVFAMWEGQDGTDNERNDK